MNRRQFLRGAAAALGAFAILLPPATTYDRIWRARPKIQEIDVTTRLILVSADGTKKLVSTLRFEVIPPDLADPWTPLGICYAASASVWLDG
jgi:hypothetical protein